MPYLISKAEITSLRDEIACYLSLISFHHFCFHFCPSCTKESPEYARIFKQQGVSELLLSV